MAKAVILCVPGRHGETPRREAFAVAVPLCEAAPRVHGREGRVVVVAADARCRAARRPRVHVDAAAGGELLHLHVVKHLDALAGCVGAPGALNVGRLRSCVTGVGGERRRLVGWERRGRAADVDVGQAGGHRLEHAAGDAGAVASVDDHHVAEAVVCSVTCRDIKRAGREAFAVAVPNGAVPPRVHGCDGRVVVVAADSRRRFARGARVHVDAATGRQLLHLHAVDDTDPTSGHVGAPNTFDDGRQGTGVAGVGAKGSDALSWVRRRPRETLRCLRCLRCSRCLRCLQCSTARHRCSQSSGDRFGLHSRC